MNSKIAHRALEGGSQVAGSDRYGSDVRSKTYKVMGMVSKPGTFPITRPIHVSDALADTGNFLPYANKKDIHIIRGGGKQVLKFNWNDFRQGKNLDKDILLENGDIIEVRD